MISKSTIFRVLLLLVVFNFMNTIYLVAKKENEAGIVSNHGYIAYKTIDTKATTKITWSNTGFIIRLDYVASRNPLCNQKYAVIRFTDKGVTRTLVDNSDKRMSIYKITEEALRKGLRESHYGNLEKEFDEKIKKGEPIYLNAIFQVHHNGKPYGNEIYTYNGGVDSRGHKLKGIYSAECWKDKEGFQQYFNIRVLYEPGEQPVSVEYRTQYNEVLYTKNLGSAKVGKVITPNLFPEKYTGQSNSYTYDLDYSYYLNLSDPGKKQNVKYEGKSMGGKILSFFDVRKQQAEVQGGGIKFVAVYRVRTPVTEDIPSDKITVQFETPQPTGRIKADQRGYEQFEVAEGIPTTEDLYVNVFTKNHLMGYQFLKLSGIKKFYVSVERTYQLSWEEEVKGKITTESRTQTISKKVLIKRPYAYWILNYLDIFSVDGATVHNGALRGGEVAMTAKGIQIPSVRYDKSTGIDSHVFLPKNLQEHYVLPPAEISVTSAFDPPPEEDFTPYVDAKIGELIVKNDQLQYNQSTIMSDKEVEKEGPRPNLIETGKVIEKDALYQSQLTIPSEKANGIYRSSGEVIYNNSIHIGETPHISRLSYAIEDLNSVTVHTPTICDAKITDLKAYNQMVTPNKRKASLILDKSFSVRVPTYGYHNDYTGYGLRDYAKYISQRQVKFPFDVYLGKVYKPAYTWITLHADETEFYLPTWVTEGAYTVEFRAPAINSAANSDNREIYANYMLTNYVAVDSIDVEVSGRLYGLKMYDISDYPVWKDVFRKPNSLSLSGFYYSAGTKDQNGVVTGKLAKYTFPLVDGCHPYNKAEGIVGLGYSTRFKLTTIGNMYGDEDYIRIVPTFYYVDRNGKARQKVDVYYTETFNNRRNYLVRVGSEQDQNNIKQYSLASSYWQVPEKELKETANLLGITISDIKNKEANLFNFSRIVLSKSFRTFTGSKAYCPDGKIPTTLDRKRVTQSVQSWYGEYYLPSKVYVLPEGFNLMEYAKARGNIDLQEEVWLRDGYLLVNFDIQTIQKGKAEASHLSYCNKENALKGYCNMWKMEGATLSKVDSRANSFDFCYGDYVLYDLEKSAAKDYISSGTH